jgi:hypothetical protein
MIFIHKETGEIYEFVQNHPLLRLCCFCSNRNRISEYYLYNLEDLELVGFL